MTSAGYEQHLPTPIGQVVGQAIGQTAGNAKVSASELAELIGAFNEVTARLQGTHEQLHAQVARLSAELRSANEQLARSRRLAALGEMAAGIAHEVRNPLGSIRLYARMLDEDLDDRPSERETVGKIDRAAKGLAGIVEDMLSFAREFRIRRETVSARELFDAAVESCREDLVPGLDSVRIIHEAGEPGADLLLAADRGLVVRALINLIRNAIEAMVESGCARRQIRLAASASPALDVCIMTITDTGPGVPEEVIPRMFNPFFTTRQTGTGLGLAIVHRIVDAHGGQVSVRNTAEGSGACVELRLPSASTLPGDPNESLDGTEFGELKATTRAGMRGIAEARA